MKKFFAMLLALMMVLALSANAFAEEAAPEFAWWGEVYGDAFTDTVDEAGLLAVVDAAMAEGVVFYVDINAYYSISGPADADYIYDGPNGQRLVSITDATEFINDYSGVTEADWNYMVSGVWFWEQQYAWLIWDWWYDYEPQWLYVDLNTLPSESNENDAPSTGDPAVLYALTAMVSSVAAGAVLTLKKRG